MQIVIDIGEKAYKFIKATGEINMLHLQAIANAIFDGTPQAEQKDALDKIRAEIADLDDADYDHEGYYKAVTDAVKIIDKYKAESEE